MNARVTEADRAAGARIRQIRWQRGVTQQALGEATGVKFQQIQKYENGHNRMSVGFLLRACAALKVRPEAIITARSGEAPLLGREAIALARAYEALDPAHQRLIAALVAALANHADPQSSRSISSERTGG